MGLSACLEHLEKKKIYCPVTMLTALPKFLSFKKRQINCTSRKKNQTTILQNPFSGLITIKVKFTLRQKNKKKLPPKTQTPKYSSFWNLIKFLVHFSLFLFLIHFPSNRKPFIIVVLSIVGN
jgi:hypothetical protein